MNTYLLFRISVLSIQGVIEIVLSYTDNPLTQAQRLQNVDPDDFNTTSDIVILATTLLSLLSQVMFRSYLIYKMGNQTNELFSSASIITMCLIYAIQIPLVVLIALYFERPDLVGIVLVPGMALIIPIQILVCHDKAWEYFINKHPMLNQLMSNQEDFIQEENQEDTFEAPDVQISMENRSNETSHDGRGEGSSGSLQATLRKAQNEESGPRLIFVQPAPGIHL